MAMLKTKGQLSREKIIKTAVDQIYKKGYFDCSTQEIADLCGLSQTSIFYHFKNKKYLFIESINYVIKNNRSIFAHTSKENITPMITLKNLLKSNIRWALNFPEQTSMILILFNFAIHDVEFKKLADKIIVNGQKTILDVLNSFPENIHTTQVSIEFLSRKIQQYTSGVMFQILASNRPEKIAKEFEEQLDHTVNLFLNSCKLED